MTTLTGVQLLVFPLLDQQRVPGEVRKIHNEEPLTRKVVEKRVDLPVVYPV